MKLITNYELANLSIDELHGVYKKAFNELAASKPGSITHANAIASIQNIDAELAMRHVCRRYRSHIS